jgi:hypothetical protein
MRPTVIGKFRSLLSVCVAVRHALCDVCQDLRKIRAKSRMKSPNGTFSSAVGYGKSFRAFRLSLRRLRNNQHRRATRSQEEDVTWPGPPQRLSRSASGLRSTAICRPSSDRIGKSTPPPADASPPAGGGYLRGCPLCCALCRRLPAGRVVLPNSLHQPGPSLLLSR